MCRSDFEATRGRLAGRSNLHRFPRELVAEVCFVVERIDIKGFFVQCQAHIDLSPWVSSNSQSRNCPGDGKLEPSGLANVGRTC